MSKKIQVFTTCAFAIVSLITSSAYSQVKVPGVIEPAESVKRLPAKLILDPIMVEFFEAPINTKQIETHVTEYLPGSSAPVEYNVSIKADKASGTITEIMTPVNNNSKASRKIYQYADPKRLLGLETFSGNNSNWELVQEDIYSYPGMGGNKALPMRQTKTITGKDTISVKPEMDETYVYDSHMHMISCQTKEQTQENQYNKEHNLASSKITLADGQWRLLEYIYQYDDGCWVKKEEYETTNDRSRYLKKSIERKLIF